MVIRDAFIRTPQHLRPAYPELARLILQAAEPHIRSQLLTEAAKMLDEMGEDCGGFPTEVTQAMAIRDCADRLRELAAKEES